MTLDAPRAIGSYFILRRLPGGGPQTELFAAHHRDEPATRLVCLKRIHPNYDDNPLFGPRFEQEMTLARTLRHRNLVEVTDLGHDGGHFFVMEYIDGPSLEDLLSNGTMRPSLVVYVGVELCRALSFLHHSDADTGRGPLIHRDVTPHNVLLSRDDGGVKLSDFGLAKALARTGAETITEAKGKPIYLAPEQLTDDKVGTRADLFSLGVVLWRALIGTHPYGEGRPRDKPMGEWIFERTLANERRSAADAAPHAPRELAAAIEGLLQPVAARTSSAEDVFATLRQVEPLDGHTQLVEWIARADEEGRR
ncbi:MAG: serine/threonine protein kinase [Sandaracinaceae bacterium]|nr:serine/threonine protein kinase [Sandaracinaceae bacterium]